MIRFRPLEHDARATESRGADPSEVLDVVERFNQAFVDNDPDRYFTFIDEDITVLTPSNPHRVEGVPDDREEFDRGLRTYDEVAVVTYFSRGSYGPEGDEVVAYYKETDVLVKRGEGWMIVHIHLWST